jgi:NAD(P)H-dependent FMN reductase
VSADARKRLLVVHHTVSPSTHTLDLAVIEGARDPAIAGVDVEVRPALTAAVIDVLEADGYLLGSPVNLGYLSGALKHFFDQIYYPCLDATRGRPFGVYLHSNQDAAGALRAIEAITTGLGWRAAQAPLVVAGEPTRADLAAARELGGALAAGLSLDG